MTTWFTSDTHFHHKAAAMRFREGFAFDNGVEHMNHVLLTYWNSRIKPKDTVYHLGDFSFGRKEEILAILKRLNGSIRLIKGNHDHTSKWTAEIKGRFVSIERMAEIKVCGVPTTLCHYPMRSWNKSHYGSYHLHGHCHGNLPQVGRAMDVGVDTNKFQPYHEEEVAAFLEKQPIHVHEDHHNL